MAVSMLDMIDYFDAYYYNMRYMNVHSVLKFYSQNLGSDSPNKLSSVTLSMFSGPVTRHKLIVEKGDLVTVVTLNKKKK